MRKPVLSGLHNQQRRRSGSWWDRPGAAIAAALMAVLCLPVAGHGQTTAAQQYPNGTILLDAWYNSQTRKNAAGQTVYYHYKWDDTTATGYSLFGQIFRSEGIATDTLYTAPTAAKLQGVQYYMIVSPDTEKWNPHPHAMTATEAQQIASWVGGGGVLVLMANDPANANIPELDRVADTFGLHFNNVLVHHVEGDDFAMGRIDAPAEPPFTRPTTIYMKDTCSLSLSGDAAPLLTWNGDTLMAMARYGAGLVVAVADPWLYNEYTDGKKLPAPYDNYGAGKEFVAWLIAERKAVERR